MRYFIFAVLLGSAACSLGEPTEFRIPSGYMGDVVLIYGASDGETPAYEGGKRIRSIPYHGALRLKETPEFGFINDQYFYIGPDGSRTEIDTIWPASIHDTPENRADDQTVGIALQWTGRFGSSSNPCAVDFAYFYVGTKAFLLSRVSRFEISEYLNAFPVECEPAAGS